MALVVIDSELLFLKKTKTNEKGKGSEKIFEIEEVLGWVRRLTTELSVRWRLVFGFLGRTEIYGSLEEILAAELPLKGHGTAPHPHALSVSCFSSLAEAPHLGITISRRDVWDLVDFREQVGRSVHVRLGSEASDQETWDPRAILRFADPGDDEAFEAWKTQIDRIGTEFLAMADPLIWWPFLRRLGLQQPGGEDLLKVAREASWELRFCAVSALGSEPHRSNPKKMLLPAVPKRVLDPLIWSLGLSPGRVI